LKTICNERGDESAVQVRHDGPKVEAGLGENRRKQRETDGQLAQRFDHCWRAEKTSQSPRCAQRAKEQAAGSDRQTPCGHASQESTRPLSTPTPATVSTTLHQAQVRTHLFPSSQLHCKHRDHERKKADRWPRWSRHEEARAHAGGAGKVAVAHERAWEWVRRQV